ncbi:S1 RNA-binding domain-containing protein [Kitasatospora sp. NPDC057015]|uniref:S1 RNA-binding domain-containing protein n=1 Tax=Kitasatospora sp. NPDC057015 TaxID=3346001 RepID=UPI00362792DB
MPITVGLELVRNMLRGNGVFVRVEDREDGLQGLVHTGDLDESPGCVEVGDMLTVKITDVDLARRRIALSQAREEA